MKKLSITDCLTYTKIRRNGEENTENIPSQEEKESGNNLSVAVEVMWGGFHATSYRIPYKDLTNATFQGLAQNALTFLVHDLRQLRDTLSQLDLSNEG